MDNKLNDLKPLFSRKKSFTPQKRSKKMLLLWRANLVSRTIHDLSVRNKPLIDTSQYCWTSRANQALRSLANAGFQNRGVCLQAFPSVSSTSSLFHFLALVSFLTQSKPKVPFLGLLCSETKRKGLLRRLTNRTRNILSEFFEFGNLAKRSTEGTFQSKFLSLSLFHYNVPNHKLTS